MPVPLRSSVATLVVAVVVTGGGAGCARSAGPDAGPRVPPTEDGGGWSGATATPSRAAVPSASPTSAGWTSSGATSSGATSSGATSSGATSTGSAPSGAVAADQLGSGY